MTIGALFYNLWERLSSRDLRFSRLESRFHIGWIYFSTRNPACATLNNIELGKHNYLNEQRTKS